MTRRHLWYVLCGLLLLVSGALGDESAKPKLAIDLGDVRVRKALAELSKITGEKHSVEGMAGDLSLSVFAHDADPVKVRRRLAYLLELSWRIDERNGETTYILHQGEASQALQARYLADLKRQRSSERYCTQLVTEIDKALNLSPDDLAKLKQDEPYLYLMASTPLGKAVRDLLTYLGPEAFAYRDKTAFKDLEPAGQAAVREFAAAWTAAQEPADPNRQVQRSETKWDEVKLCIEAPHEAKIIPTYDRCWVGGTVYLTGGGLGSTYFQLLDPHSVSARIFSRVMMLHNESGVLISEEFQKMNDAIFAEELARAKRIEGQRVVPEELQREVDLYALAEAAKLDIQGHVGRAEAQSLFARLTGIDVYSDSLPEDFQDDESIGEDEARYQSQRLPWGKMPIWQALDKIAAQYQMYWHYEDGVVLMRHERRFQKRDWVIPEAWYARWRKALGARKTLTIDDLGKMATELTDEQAKYGLNWPSDRTLVGIGWLSRSAAEYRLYGVLTPAQKKQARQSKGLPMSTLTPAQTAVYHAALRSGGIRPAQLAQKLRLTIKRKPLDGGDGHTASVFYLLDVIGPDGKCLRSFRLLDPQ